MPCVERSTYLNHTGQGAGQRKQDQTVPRWFWRLGRLGRVSLAEPTQLQQEISTDPHTRKLLLERGELLHVFVVPTPAPNQVTSCTPLAT